MADNRRPSSAPSEEFYKTRMANSANASRKSSMQAGTETPHILCGERALFIFAKDNVIRKVCRTIIEMKVSFDAGELSLCKNVFSALALSVSLLSSIARVERACWLPCQCLLVVKVFAKFFLANLYCFRVN